MGTKDPNLNKSLKDKSEDTPSESSDKSFDNTNDNVLESNVKGNETVKADIYNSKHVNDGDNPARQPDRRDQQGSAFGGTLDEKVLDSDKLKTASDHITDENKYNSVDNAQANTLPTNHK